MRGVVSCTINVERSNWVSYYPLRKSYNRALLRASTPTAAAMRR